jgi:hypothetical protein
MFLKIRLTPAYKNCTINSKLHLETVSMHQSIENLKSTTFGGRRFTRKQIVEIKSTVCNFTKLSRRELANTVCEHLGWFTPTGENRSQACLNALEQMEAAICLHYQPK